MFEPLRTERLLLRAFRAEDVAGLVARRNHPDVARYQDWKTPFGADRAEALVEEVIAMGEPQHDGWWMAVVCDADGGAVVGDLALHLGPGGRTAEVGYSLDPAHWGNGYAVEAVEALVAHCFEELGVTRVFGMLHPDNIASAQVLERTGFLFEGHTKSSYWLGDECSDDWIYGLVRSDWEAWRDRPRTPPTTVALEEVAPANERAVYRLATHKTQESFVAPMSDSFADALFPEVVDGAPLVPWMRAVVADGEVVGFVMLALVTDHHPDPYLWRLLIDRRHQRRGIGSRSLDLVEDVCREMGGSVLVTSWEEGRGSPAPFYLARGFVPTGRIVDGETEARFALDR